VFVQAEVQRGELRAVADVYAQSTFWARLREGEGAPEAHAFASARLDAELRSFLVPAPLVARAEVRVPLPERPILAVSCEDVTGTGALELVLVGRRAIHVGVVREQRFVTRQSTPWSDHSPVAPSPVQEPLVSVAVRAGQELLVGSTDRAQTLRFSPELTAIGKSGRALPWPSGGCSRVDGVTLAGNVAPCFEGDRDGPRWAASFPTETADPPAPAAPATTAPFLRGADALASTSWVDREGRWRAARALRESSSSEVRVVDSEGRALRLPRRGAQLALGDVDADGDLEVLTSLDVLDPARDELVIESWRANGRAEERKRVPVPSGVRALAACPSDDSARSARLAVATGNELWILR
jgi:hypothetical protein